ncbi:MAG TPA: isoprenylcysteine carboxylmethyltransferase family protein [Thermoanaerobaculia bacterium]
MKDRPAIIAPPPLLGLACIAAGFIAARFKPLPFFPGPSSVRVAFSVALFLIPVAIVFVARRELIKHKEHPNPYKPTSAIVSSGIYGFSRNPIYIAFLIVVLATAIAANNAWLLLSIVLLFVLLQFGVVRAEERYLSGKFGAEYEEYRRSVRRWV